MKLIKYIKSRHEYERITKWLDPDIESNWVESELIRLKTAGIKAYVVRKRKNIAICRRGLIKLIIRF